MAMRDSSETCNEYRFELTVWNVTDENYPAALLSVGHVKRQILNEYPVIGGSSRSS